MRHARDLEAAADQHHPRLLRHVRQHAVEAGLDPQFEVMEEVLAVNLRTDAVAACLQRLLTSADAGRRRPALILLHGWRIVRDTVESLLHSHDAAAWTAWASRPADAVGAGVAAGGAAELLPLHLEHLLTTRPAIARVLDLLRRYPPLPGPMRESSAILLTETPHLPRAADLAGGDQTAA
ncbi:MAG: hypothetical protein U0736_01695 [Gemmataceae bacterium]